MSKLTYGDIREARDTIIEFLFLIINLPHHIPYRGMQKSDAKLEQKILLECKKHLDQYLDEACARNRSDDQPIPDPNRKGKALSRQALDPFWESLFDYCPHLAEQIRKEIQYRNRSQEGLDRPPHGRHGQ